jgi:site-specific DNA-methyltransferase (adenine-specific)
MADLSAIFCNAMLDLDKIYCHDSLELMQILPSQSIDLIVTSPPYNIRNSTGGGLKRKATKGKWPAPDLCSGYANHGDNMPHEQYVEWQRNCLDVMLRILKDNGAIFYNHKWRVQNGLLQDRHDIVAGFPVRQIIIWQRSGGVNFNDSYFLPTYEVIYLIAKKSFRLIKKANAIGDVWKVKQESGKNKHPAPFPVEIPARCIRATNAQIILDPFCGSGSTCIAAMQLQRNFIGIDLSPEYCEIANQRIYSESIKQMK